MRVAVFEDEPSKWEHIKRVLISKGVREGNIRNIDTTARYLEFSHIEFDLYIIDVQMPAVIGGSTRDAGLEILQMLDYSGRVKVPVLAITSYLSDISSKIRQYQARGCIVFDYGDEESWSQALNIYIAQAQERGRYDFLIFVAIAKERVAYLNIVTSDCKQVIRDGLNILEFEHGGKQGGVILCPRMGLVNATAIVSKALGIYSPTMVAMSGICAGIGSSSAIGQLLVTDIVWEYQSGKWLDEAFEAEPYQVSIDESIRPKVVEALAEPRLLNRLEAYYKGDVRPSSKVAPKLAAFTTGSAVIASKKRLKHVKAQHRKVEGLDMEVYGFHRAVQLSGSSAAVISAKTVVDVADSRKGDEYHEYGCFISAAFVLEFIGQYYNG
ncbi:response regulator [Methylorubrum populi]|uniref:response regulator n=1 Tax=Methylorubrum populi TaxID=223967 RepID=UPI0011528E60|nr:response regulator [Methylorubrum populi]QDI82258.1 response regulator [Methylorubrum populi]